jgi:hypothetical protein
MLNTPVSEWRPTPSALGASETVPPSLVAVNSHASSTSVRSRRVARRGVRSGLDRLRAPRVLGSSGILRRSRDARLG